jgi:hypothetical protein
MSLESKKSNIVMLTVLAVVLIVGTGFAIMLLATKLGDTERDLTKANALTLELSREKEALSAVYNDVLKQVEELRKQPVDTSGDDLLKRDIFIYIDKKFQLVPRTAAIDIANQIVENSRALGVSPELVVGIVEVESGFNASAVSSANARGLMQVMPEWAKKFGLKKVSDLHDIDTGIECGIKVLKIHIEEEGGNLTKGLFKYVGGSDAYAGKVYTAMGKFVAYRSFIPDNYEKQEEKEVNEVSTK